MCTLRVVAFTAPGKFRHLTLQASTAGIEQLFFRGGGKRKISYLEMEQPSQTPIQEVHTEKWRP